MIVLRSAEEIIEAHRRAAALGICSVPDKAKAWDNLLAVEAIQAHPIGLHEPIADVGCRSGIVLTWLDQLGFRRLFGCDLRRPYPPIRSALARRLPRTAVCGIRMYARNRRRMVVAPAEQTPFADGVFAAVTAMSVIEHGVDVPGFFREAARLLRAGGLLVVSTDYWPDGVDTAGLRRFTKAHGDDRVFSAEDVAGLVEEASANGLSPLRDLDLDAYEPIIESDGLRYTFLVLGFERQ